LRTIEIPGVSAGTTNIDSRLWAAASGFVTAMTM